VVRKSHRSHVKINAKIQEIREAAEDALYASISPSGLDLKNVLHSLESKYGIRQSSVDFIAFCEGVIATYKAAGKAGTANVCGESPPSLSEGDGAV